MLGLLKYWQKIKQTPHSCPRVIEINRKKDTQFISWQHLGRLISYKIIKLYDLKYYIRDRQTKTWQNTVIFSWSVEGSFSLLECCISPRQVSRSYQITISRCQDAPYPPRIHHQRWMIGAVLTMKMTISGKDCFTKVVPNNDTDIWTPSPEVRMPSIIQGSSTRDGR